MDCRVKPGNDDGEGAALTSHASSPRKRGPIRRVFLVGCDVWVPGLEEFIIGPRFARTRWLTRDDKAGPTHVLSSIDLIPTRP
jgi:hypothetical protein